MRTLATYVVTTALSLALIACAGPNTLKQAEKYCLKNAQDDYSACLKHRYRYLEARQKLVSRHREDRGLCEAQAKKALGIDDNSCFHAGNTSKVSGESGSVSAGVSRDVDCDTGIPGTRTVSSTDMRNQSKQVVLEKQCMLSRGWENPRSPSKELRLLSREYGFEKEEYEAR